jgi:hypothetical protein
MLWEKTEAGRRVRMSQVIVAQSDYGIILAVEKRAIQVNEKGEEVSLTVDRLIPLAPSCALITAGAVEGVEMGKSLREFLRGEGLTDVQDLYGASLAFLATEHDRLEYQLNQMGKANASLEELVAKVKEGIDKFRVQGSVSGSFSWGRITGAGFESLAV